MRIPKAIFENQKAEDFLIERWLLKQYQKSKEYILSWFFGWTNFGQIEPKSDDLRYFRINKQYRAIATFDDDNNLIVFRISDHQSKKI